MTRLAAMKVFGKSLGCFAIIGCCFLCTSLSPTVVRAECGDYVIISRPLVQPGLTNWRSRFLLPDMNRLGGPMDHAPKQPCHGPSCHSRDSLPSAPTGASSLTVPQWAYLGFILELSLTGSNRFTDPERDTWSTGRADPIYHPPRLS